MQNSNPLYNDSEIPTMTFRTTMIISHLHNKQMNGMKDEWNVTSDQLNISKLPTMELYECNENCLQTVNIALKDHCC